MSLARLALLSFVLAVVLAACGDKPTNLGDRTCVQSTPPHICG